MVKKSALKLIKAYKWLISPMLPPSCRFYPTCSDYAAEAIEAHGVLKGVGYAVYRLLRCHPYSKGGMDPVPNTLKSNESACCAGCVTEKR